MKKQENFWKETMLGAVVKTLIKAAVILSLIVALMLLLLNFYTNHGKSETVPALKGFTIEEATTMLARHNLKFEIIDSAYVRGKKLGTVIEQNPAPNTIVKPGRPIYLIINSKTVRQLSVPNLRDISLRQAEAVAKSLGIHVANVEYVSSEYRDLVLDVKYNGKRLLPGDKVPEGGYIVLVAGDGAGQIISGEVPSLIGIDLITASRMLSAASMILGGIIYDVPPAGDEDKYIIYNQRPSAGEASSDGMMVDVWLSKNPIQAKDEFVQPQQPKREQKKEKVEDIEDFF